MYEKFLTWPAEVKFTMRTAPAGSVLEVERSTGISLEVKSLYVMLLLGHIYWQVDLPMCEVISLPLSFVSVFSYLKWGSHYTRVID
jgi:hypothetical protein